MRSIAPGDEGKQKRKAKKGENGVSRTSSEAQVSEMAESIIQDVAEFLFEDEEFGSSLEVSWCNRLRPQKLWPKSPRMPLCTPSVSKSLWTLNPPFNR